MLTHVQRNETPASTVEHDTCTATLFREKWRNFRYHPLYPRNRLSPLAEFDEIGHVDQDTRGPARFRGAHEMSLGGYNIVTTQATLDRESTQQLKEL